MEKTPEVERTAAQCLETIERYKEAPLIIGYIFFNEMPIGSQDLVALLLGKGFDDVGIATVFLGGMLALQCVPDLAAVVAENTGWNEKRVDIAITRAKLYYLHYKPEKKVP